MKKLSFILIFLCCSLIVHAQYFEGWVTYRASVLNPNPEMIPDSTWQAQLKETLGDRGNMIQKYYYKKGTYFTEVDAGRESGYQVLDPKKKLLYSWEKDSDTAVVVNVTKYMDKVTNIIHFNDSEEVMGIQCKKLLLQTKFSETTLWYNPQHFKMDPELVKDHKYGHWEAIVKEIGCLPLKMEIKGFMTHMVQEAIAYSAENVDDTRFIVPNFTEVIENPF